MPGLVAVLPPREQILVARLCHSPGGKGPAQPLSPCRQPGEAEPSQGGVAVLPARAADGRHGHLPTPQYIVDQQKLTRRWKEEQ